MSASEIQELLDLTGWSKTKLAAELDVTESTVHQWMSGRRHLGGPASILMRLWLSEAKAHKSNGKGKRAKAGAH